MAYLYRHIRLDKNEPFYIGIGNDKYYNRAFAKTGRNKIWHNIVSKTEYEVEIIYDGMTKEQAFEKEKEFIKLYGRKNLGTGTLCNLTNGGEGGFGIVRSEENKRKISEKMKGKKNALGHKHSEETKRLLSEKMYIIKNKEQFDLDFELAHLLF
jgi:hypothetical protein